MLLSLARNLGWFSLALAASTRLNGKMLRAVLRAPLSFFHTTPTGRILNVFSKDQGSVDEQLPQVRRRMRLFVTRSADAPALLRATAEYQQACPGRAAQALLAPAASQ